MKSPLRRRCSTTSATASSSAPGAGPDDEDDDEEAKREAAKAAKAAKARSLEVQRNLASRLVEAQSRWLEPPSKSRDSSTATQTHATSRSSSQEAEEAGGSGGAGDEDLGGGGLAGDGDDTVVGEAYTRGQWLLGLLVLQSSSSVVLQSKGSSQSSHPHSHHVRHTRLRPSSVCFIPPAPPNVCAAHHHEHGIHARIVHSSPR